MTESAVSVMGVRHVYAADGIVALDGVSFDVAAGEVVGVVGENGSGKSTLARIVAGLIRPTAGSVRVGGVDASAQPPGAMAQRAGFVFQNPNHQLLAPTVGEELALGPRNLGVARDDVGRRVDEAAAAFGLASVLAVHPYRLPLRLRKLVALASVATMRPPVVVLDEPTTGQDRPTREAIARFVRGLRETGTTVLCASHDMELLAATADRVLVLARGRLLADAPPRAVFGDEALLEAARLAPPAITTLGRALAARGLAPASAAAVLSVDDLVHALRRDAAGGA